MSADPPLVTHRGGCHCGGVRFEFDAPAEPTITLCNCSICAPYGGYGHLIVPGERFRLLAGDDVLTAYTFNTGTARHLFCSVCGVKSFYVPRSHPDGFSVNVHCVEPGTIRATHDRRFDGRNWERSRETLRT